MNKFVALLRAINVGGTRVIKMDDLKSIFVSCRMDNVFTYIQSGNFIFETEESEAAILEGRIEVHLEKSLGYKVEVFLRSMDEIAAIANQIRFKLKDGETLHVVFLRAKPDKRLAQTLLSHNSKADEFAVVGREVVNLRRDRDQSVFTNNFIEKILKAPATTRNWNTICKITEKYG